MNNPVKNDNRALLFSDIPMLVKTLRKQKNQIGLVRDEDGYYNNFHDWLTLGNDGKDYCSFFPDYDYDSRPEGTKLYANADMVCTPSTNDDPGQDDYYGVGPFRYYDVNITPFADGTCKIRNIKGVDEDYSNTDDDAWIAAPVLYEKIVHSEEDHGTYVHLSDIPKEGYQAQPGAYLPDGRLRDFMVYAKYPASIDAVTGKWQSRSGKIPTRKMSYNICVNYSLAQTDGTGAKTAADDWYPKIMMLMKYATKNSQNIYKGVSSYSFQKYPAIAQTDQSSVIVSNTDAAVFTVGLYISIGEKYNGSSVDRSYDIVHSHADTVKVLSITPIENTSNSLITFDCEPFNSTTDTVISSMMPKNGLTDTLLGTDGCPISNSVKYPFRIQGIELMGGAFEIIGNLKVLHKQETTNDTSKNEVYIAYNKTNYSTSASSIGYEHLCDFENVAGSSAGSIYPKDFTIYNNLIMPSFSKGGSTTTGLGDYIYTSAATAADGWRVFLSLGSLSRGAYAGLFCVALNYALSSAGWGCWSRLSDLCCSQA